MFRRVGQTGVNKLRLSVVGQVAFRKLATGVLVLMSSSILGGLESGDSHLSAVTRLLLTVFP